MSLGIRGVEVYAHAQSLIGVRFRLHGRDESGLDCVGLIVLVYARAGFIISDALRDYPLRGVSLARIEQGLEQAGFVRRDGGPQCGDVVVIDCGHSQYHLVLMGEVSHVHAHAGLRRVVETPGNPESIKALFRYCG